MASSYVFDNSSNSAYEFDLRVTFDFIVRGIVGLYSYDVNSREFTLINETSDGSDVLNGKFNSTKVLYVNFYVVSNRGCTGINFDVTGPENITVIEPTPEPVVDPTIYTTESTGDSDSLSAGVIAGIVIGGVILIVLTLILVVFFKKITSFITTSFGKLGKKMFQKSATNQTLEELDDGKKDACKESQANADDAATNQVEVHDVEALDTERPIQISAIAVQTNLN